MTRVLIVGAGPTGLTAAAFLAEGGVMPTVIERRSGPSALSRAVGIIPATLDLLEPLGVSDAIRAEAVAIRQMRLHRRGRLVTAIDVDRDGTGQRIYALPQDRTEAHLAEAFAARDGTVRYGTKLEGLKIMDTGAVARFGGKEHPFDAVIGADGIQSTVRTAAGLSYDGIDVPGVWSIADVDVRDWPNPQSFSLYLCDKGVVVMVIPLEAARFRLVSNTKDALTALPVPIQIERLRRTGTFAISVRQASSYQSGPVFLAGDAAHCHSPVGGRGMNLGIADAADLAARILSETTEGYTVARHPIGAAVMKRTENVRKALTSANPIMRAGVMALLQIIAFLPMMHPRIARGIVE